MEEAHREDVAEGGGLEREAAAQVGRHPAEMTGVVPSFEGALDHGAGEVGRNEPGPLPEDEAR